MSQDIVLSLKDVKVHYPTYRGLVRAVDGVSFDVRRGETFGLVGETGCGKSVTCLAIMKLVSSPGICEGEVLFEGNNLLALDEDRLKKIRGKEISMIFQDPAAALDPVFRIGDQLVETIMLHQKLNKKEAKEKAIDLLKMTEIPSASERIRDYPNYLSRGMLQRVMIAIAISCNPRLLIADEPTTALDVTIQAQVLELIRDLKQKIQSTILIVTHDLGIVAETCDRVAVMYAGKVAEIADVKTIFKKPRHPYFMRLLSAIPRVDKPVPRLNVISGHVPNGINFPSGCRFHPRCDSAREICKAEIPELREVEPGHWVACHLA